MSGEFKSVPNAKIEAAPEDDEENSTVTGGGVCNAARTNLVDKEIVPRDAMEIEEESPGYKSPS